MALLAMLSSSVLMTACNNKSTQNQDSVASKQVQVVDADRFKELLADTTMQLVDVRTAEEYAQGHIENALLLPVNESDFLQKALEQLDKERPVLLYCRSGRRSAKAANMLRHEGFVQIYDLSGGYKSYPFK